MTTLNDTDRVTTLQWVIREIAWMARRYADGRSTYAPGMLNEALQVAIRNGCKIDPDKTLPDPNWATDGQFGRWDPVTKRWSDGTCR